MSIIPNILFLHIPRTAGTSFRYYLLSSFGVDNVAPVPVPLEMKESYPFLPVENLYTAHGEFQQTDKPIIMGHYDWSAVDFYTPRHIVTILREPVQRCLSAYSHYRQDPSNNSWSKQIPRDLTITQLLKHPEGFQRMSNQQVRILSGKRWADTSPLTLEDLALAKYNLDTCLFGVTEMYDEFIQRFNILFDLQNTSTYVNSYPRIKVSKMDIQDLYAANELDTLLYNYARRKLDYTNL